MGLVTAGRSPAGPYFTAPATVALTDTALAAVGLPVEPFAPLTMDLVRTSPKGKWHVPGGGLDRCPQLTRAYGYDSKPLPVQSVSVLGDYDYCARCAHRAGPPGPAGVLFAAAGLILAAAAWVADLEAGAGRMDWLEVARWSCQTPFGPPDPMPDLLGRLSGARGWARHRVTVVGVWKTLRDRADAAWERGRQAAGPPGLRALAARARDLVSRDPDTRAEAALIEAIADAHPAAALYRPDLWTEAVNAWLHAVAADGDPRAGHAAMRTVVEARYGNAPVRDVSLLPTPALTPGDGHPSPGAWAATEYRAVRHALVDAWCTRLTTALRDTPTPTEHEEQLLLVVGWPIIHGEDRELAYLTQYPILDRVVALAGDQHPRPQRVPWAVVLRVPTFAAEHAAAHRGGGMHAAAGPTIAPTAHPDPADVRALLRRAAGYLPADADTDPTGPLPQVAGWRAEIPYRSGLRAWVAAGARPWDLPARWQWVPDEDANHEPDPLAVLAHLCTALRHHHEPVMLRVATGPADALTPANLLVYPHDVDTRTATLAYRAHHLPACPPMPVPLRRIIAITATR